MNRFATYFVCWLWLICTVPTVFIHAQDGVNSDDEKAGSTTEAAEKNPLELQVTLLLVNSSWLIGHDADTGRLSKHANAEQIEAEVKAAIDGKPIPEMYRDRPAAYGSEIWFPEQHAAAYDPDELASLIAWLRKHKLIQSVQHGESFNAVTQERFPPNSAYARLAVGKESVPMPYLLPKEPQVPLIQHDYKWNWFARGNLDIAQDNSGNFVTTGKFRLQVDSHIVVEGSYPTSTGGQKQWIVKTLYTGQAHADEPVSRKSMIVIPWYFDSNADSQKLLSPVSQGTGGGFTTIRPIVVVYEAPMGCPWLDETDTHEPALNLPKQLIPLVIENKPDFDIALQPNFKATDDEGGPNFKAVQGEDGKIRGIPSDTEDARSNVQSTGENPPSFQSFSLRYAEASQVKEIIEPFFRNYENYVFLSPDDRTNILLAQAPEEFMSKIEVLIQQLDVPSIQEEAPGRDDFLRSLRGGEGNLDDLREDYAESDNRARELAKQTQTASQHMAAEHPTLKKLRHQLRETVTKTFRARQDMQKAQIAELLQELEELERSVQMREQLQEQIIDQRVEELLK